MKRCEATIYPPPNPVAAAQQVAAQAAERLYQHATPKPKPSPYDSGWDGKRCCYIYSPECLAEWPQVPTFQLGEQAA